MPPYESDDGVRSISPRPSPPLRPSRSKKTDELTPVYYPSEAATVDIIFVHGLNGDALKTWTSESGCFWPEDLLPTTLDSGRVHARILTYSYDTSKSEGITYHARKLAETIASDRNVSYPNPGGSKLGSYQEMLKELRKSIYYVAQSKS